MSTKIQSCRICHNPNLTTIFDLGLHSLSSRFPAANEPDPIAISLILVKCDDSTDQSHCGLLQLSDTTSSDELYLQHYGYRSGLNNTMITHLGGLVAEIINKVKLSAGDIILDIGSNDCTLLKAYTGDFNRVGIDPTGTQFKQYYPDDICLLPTFFSADVFTSKYGDQKAKIITTVSMFYDLPDPVAFAKDIKSILADDGIWVTEQSYCVTMLENNSFDTACHEHLEYYTMKQIHYIANSAGLKIIDVSLNDCNGGSFRVTLSHDGTPSPNVKLLTDKETELSLHNLIPLHDFINRCEIMKTELMSFLREEKSKGKTIYLYSASTKGNTLLQYYGLDNSIITAAAERNPEKYGRRTPGTNIPIECEDTMRKANPDYLLVLAWHFKKEFLRREREYMDNGGTIIFPMPRLEIYSHSENVQHRTVMCPIYDD